MRASATNAAAFVATAINAVTGVGAPSYTSGVHWWKGAIEVLNARPVAMRATPMSSSESVAFPLASTWLMVPKSVDPAAP